MKTIKEFLLDKSTLTPQTLYIPVGAEVVSTRDSDSGIALVTIITPTVGITDLRTFKICTLDENIYTDAVKYIGSFNSDLGVRYIIEIL